jgi:hypothetical protein
MTRARSLLRIAFAVYVVAGFAAIVALLFSAPWVIGSGRVHEALTQLEERDLRWWALAPLVLLWAGPLLAVGSYFAAKRAGVEAESVRSLLSGMLENKRLPMTVDVDTRVPVRIDAPLRVPVEINTVIPVDEMIDIETHVPIRTSLKLDTDVETSVFGIGKIKVPIRAMVPIDMVLPVVGKIRIRSVGLPVHLKEEVLVTMPPFEVPLKTRIETKIDLLDNLRVAEQLLRKRLAGEPKVEAP